MKRKMKRTTKQYITVALICIIVMGSAEIFTSTMLTGQIKDKYTALLMRAHQEIENNQRTCYVALGDIMTGDYITVSNVSSQTVFSGQPPESYITSEDIGKVALIDIKTGTQLLKGMLSEDLLSTELREVEYSAINISSNIANNDTVDLRLSYPNGEDYCVLSKKIIKGYTGATPNCLFWLTEDEIIRMDSAMIDAVNYTGSFLYTTKYVEPNLQSATIVNYVPSVEAMNLIIKSPNVLENAKEKLNEMVRKALENRLATSFKKDISVEKWDLGSNYIYQQYDITPTSIPAEDSKETITSDQELPKENDLSKSSNITDEEQKIGTDYFVITKE